MGAPGTSRGTRVRGGLRDAGLEDDWVLLRDLGSFQGKEILTVFICSVLQGLSPRTARPSISNLPGFLHNPPMSLSDDAMSSEGRQMSDLASEHRPVHLH